MSWWSELDVSLGKVGRRLSFKMFQTLNHHPTSAFIRCVIKTLKQSVCKIEKRSGLYGRFPRVDRNAKARADDGWTIAFCRDMNLCRCLSAKRQFLFCGNALRVDQSDEVQHDPVQLEILGRVDL